MSLSSRVSNTLARCRCTWGRGPLTHHASITVTTQQKRAFTQSLAQPVQIYRSTSTDPYLNLSIEHHLLQHSHPDSTVLFLYANRPSVVIGRNQNPWLEVNLHLLRQGLPPQPSSSSLSSDLSPPPSHNGDSVSPGTQPKPTPIALVRRRSGGGTVFHDSGNINFSVICPPAVFDRDRHAEMVARALRRLGVGRARVNGRHDIVVDVDDEGLEGAAAESAGGGLQHQQQQTFKVSGSAYKLTRTRSLHHGTCLLSSPNLSRISPLLRSPAEGFVKARGVESVRSAIRNVGVEGAAFVETVEDEFRKMYGEGDGAVVVVGEEEALANEEVVKGLRELTSPDWIFGQTPQFTFSTHPTEDDPRERPPSVRDLPYGFEAHITFRHGEIQSAAVHGIEYANLLVDDDKVDAIISQNLVSKRLHDVRDWGRTLRSGSPTLANTKEVGSWLNHIFGIEPAAKRHDPASVAEITAHAISQTPVGAFLNANPAESTS